MAQIRIKRTTSTLTPEQKKLLPGELGIEGDYLLYGAANPNDEGKVTPTIVAVQNAANAFTGANSFTSRPTVNGTSVALTSDVPELKILTVKWGDNASESGTYDPTGDSNKTITLDVYTKKEVTDAIDNKVAAAVKYLGTTSSIDSLTPDSIGDFARAGSNFEYNSTQVHAGDLIVCETLDPVTKSATWSIIHGDYKANAKNVDGYVAGPKDNDTNKVWMTDASGNPSWLSFSPVKNISCEVAGSAEDTGWTWLIGSGNSITMGAAGSDQLVVSNVDNATKVVLPSNTWVKVGDNLTQLSDFGGALKDVKINGHSIKDESGTFANIPIATDEKLGVIQLGYSTSDIMRKYAVELDGGKAYVNVPWANDNTTYTAGDGLKLTGTTFSVDKIDCGTWA